MAKNVKSRSWTFIIYPESAPESWEDNMMGLTYCYCLHNRDVVKSTGELKKAHIHVVLTFDGPTTFNVVKELTDRLNGPLPQAVKSLRGMIRYLIHADNKEKFQYDRKDIKSVGMDREIEQAFMNKKTDDDKKLERVACWKQVMNIINGQKLRSWEELDNVLQELGDVDLIDYVGNHAYLVGQHLNENWHKYK